MRASGIEILGAAASRRKQEGSPLKLFRRFRKRQATRVVAAAGTLVASSLGAPSLATAFAGSPAFAAAAVSRWADV
jgi:hypothetical protein